MRQLFEGRAAESGRGILLRVLDATPVVSSVSLSFSSPFLGLPLFFFSSSVVSSSIVSLFLSSVRENLTLVSVTGVYRVTL